MNLSDDHHNQEIEQMDIVLDEREKVQDTLHTFIVSVTAKDLGLELQEDVLGLDDGLYVRAVKNDGPLASSQILRGDQILMVASEDVALAVSMQHLVDV